jgi:micrococcal nuclease
MLLLLLAGCSPVPAQEHLRPSARVLRVVDGDTVVVLLGGKPTTVRVIGVDAPVTVGPRKPVERFGRESARRGNEDPTRRR